MLEYDELKEAVDNGHIKGDTVAIVRKNGKVFDYILPHEEARPWEVVTIESVEALLAELWQSTPPALKKRL